MRYVLTVKRLEKNEDYEQEKKEMAERRRYQPEPFRQEYPQSEIPVLALEVIVTEEEFTAIKKATLEVIK